MIMQLVYYETHKQLYSTYNYTTTTITTIIIVRQILPLLLFTQGRFLGLRPTLAISGEPRALHIALRVPS